MGIAEASLESGASQITKKRKYEQSDELEVQLDAPEPPSRKALRKAKKGKGLKDDGDDVHVDRKEQIAQAKNESSNSIPPVFKEQPKRTGFGIWIGNLVFTTTAESLQAFFTTTTKPTLF